ncbi:CmpA/NrtA family ABC transporter substrate-binding protein [Roseibium limicola]|uniref:ABC transporter substrate-binding protein n=1 Tax=Roseibium limicola TaxID=2816037 RepID=A0A939J8H4_9HYPH|nr:CmpA/NrtA family ABC transporter substrate-binding protein [Roseibium limicola]MBO0345321.1 ABC transporter substrate-binding protein [Roseibium limicola]
MSAGTLDSVVAGYIPLLDSALLVIASTYGFAEEQGIDLKLIRETSWANIRDRIAVGHFDVAHMLGPMPIAASLKITTLAVPMRAAMFLGLGGNAITVSNALWADLQGEGAAEDGEPRATGEALASLVRKRADAGRHPLRFGVVHPFSGHAYELRYWLAGVGIHPDRDVEISVLPPPLMPDALTMHQIDGYCVGEPWNTVSVLSGRGRIVTFKEAIWPSSPEKVLGVTESWAARNPDVLHRLIQALKNASDWCALKENATELAQVLARQEFLDCPAEACLPALTGRLQLGKTGPEVEAEIFKVSGYGAQLPNPHHGLWFYSQMVRWGQAIYSDEDLKVVQHTFAPDIYSSAMGLAPLTAGRADLGFHFFDGLEFNPENVKGYIDGFKIRS